MDHKQFQTLVAVAEGIADELHRVGDFLERRLNLDALKASHDLPLAIKTARLEAGLTQAQAAERSGMSKQYWNVLEQGRKRPGPETLKKMAQTLGKQPWELVDFRALTGGRRPAETEADNRMAGTIRELIRAGRSLESVRAEMVEAAMRECRGNRTRAARLLGLNRTTLVMNLRRLSGDSGGRVLSEEELAELNTPIGGEA